MLSSQPGVRGFAGVSEFYFEPKLIEGGPQGSCDGRFAVNEKDRLHDVASR
jgi:hypothetical protein